MLFGSVTMAMRKWTELESPIPVVTLWGRSGSDVYGGGRGLAHFDGQSWAETSSVGPVEGISGTKAEVLVARGGE